MDTINPKIRKKVREKIEAQFPEMKGVEPSAETITIKPEPAVYKKLSIALPRTPREKKVYKFTFKNDVQTEDGVRIPRIVKVLIDSSGTILKISTSR